MADQQHNRIVEDHKAWTNSLRPDGLVVSPTVLTEAQAVLPAPDPEQQRRFNEFVVKRGTVVGGLTASDAETTSEQADEPCIADMPRFLVEFLGWPAELIHGLDPARPIPESLRVPLPDFGIELGPTLALRNPKPSDPAQPWHMLVQTHPVGADLHERQAGDWDASHAQRFDKLLRETKVPLGLVTDGRFLRLVFAPEKESSGSLTFPVEFMTKVSGRKVLAGLHLMLSGYRIVSAPTAARLLTLCVRSRDFQATVSTTLAGQVIDAAFELIRGLQAAHEHSHGVLLADVLARRPNEVYEGMLTVLMRLVFTLYAEDRGLFPTSSLYVQDYGIHGLFERLRTDAARNPDTMDQRYGGWWRLFTLFRMIHAGSKHPKLDLPPRFGYLFDPDRFPWLEGRAGGVDDIDAQTIPAVPDGTLHRVLEKLLVLDGERLSYRTLDVEQIGSVYEVMMGFGIGLADGPSIAIKPKKKLGAPVPVNLDALLAQPPASRTKWLKEKTDHELTARQSGPLKDATTADDLLAALDTARKIARSATPQPLAKGAMLLVPSDERRRSGSNYTPRKLTEPIVRKTLEPIFANLGPRPTPAEILDLKVCDPAMGSGAFLVEACRQLAERLVVAWDRHGGMPPLPPDETKTLLAQRLVAQKCLYGVDKNPMAADLAKLSLWLATLAKDHAFTFLDHSLRSGDSLVGLTRKQISALHWAPQKQLPLVADRLAKAIDRAGAYRRDILEAGDFLSPELKSQKLANADDALSQARLIGDCMIAAFFNAEKLAKRQVMLDKLALVVDPYVKQTGDWAKQRTILGDFATWLRGQPRDSAVVAGGEALADAKPISHPLVPFHWEIEFPEVFQRENPGFDAIVGNPPFLGGTRISELYGMAYFQWVVSLFPPCEHHCDLVAFFLRKAFDLLRRNATLGLISTNTVAQGDTREGGLAHILKAGGSLFNVTRRLRWPGEAAVVVSVVHVAKNVANANCFLDGRTVERISAFLLAGSQDSSPSRLATTPYFSLGSKIYGQGFLFADGDPKCTPIAERTAILNDHPDWESRIPPYLVGEDLNSSPTHDAKRFVIYLSDVEDEEVLATWPELREIVATKVRPERLRLGDNPNNVPLKRKWWAYQAHRPELYSRIARHDHVLCISRVGEALAFTFAPSTILFSEAVVVFDISSFSGFAITQGRCHEVWARFLASSMKDDLRYTPSDCFETFPFPENLETDAALEDAGKAYYEFRADLMVRNNEGLTKTYNRFHDPAEPSADIAWLRRLHAEMDRAVLTAYDWKDVPTACGFALDWLDLDDDELANTLAEAPDDVRERIESADYFFPDAASACRFQSHIKKQGRGKLPWRHRWPDDVRDDVLARLLALNAKRAEAERLAGLSAPPRPRATDDGDDADQNPDDEAKTDSDDGSGNRGDEASSPTGSPRPPRGRPPSVSTAKRAKKATKRATKKSAPRPLLPDDSEP